MVSGFARPTAARTRFKTAVSAACLACAAALAAPASHALVLLTTDSAWKVTPSAPVTADWLDSTSFDDSAWQAATELYNVSAGNPGFSGKGIWSAGGQFSTSETQIWARRTFDLATLPVLAILNNGFDDDGDIYVNGVKVVDDHNGFANNSSANITSHLVTGTNLIAFTASDNFPVWGYNHSAWLQIDATFAQVPEPGTLALLGLGIACLGFARRRAAA